MIHYRLLYFSWPKLNFVEFTKVKTISLSSIKVKYRAIANTIAKLLWVQLFLSKLQIKLQHPPTLWCNNISTTYMIANPLFHLRTKHISIDYHFVCDQVASRSLLSYEDQLADALRKPLPVAWFSFIRHKFNVRELPLNLQGYINNKIIATETSSNSK